MNGMHEELKRLKRLRNLFVLHERNQKYRIRSQG
jgi:hypothetical protein